MWSYFGLLAASLAVSAQTVSLDSTIFYNVKVAGGKVSGCSPLNNMLSNRGCDNTVQDLWAGCQMYLSSQDCSGKTTTDLFGIDDGSGRQRWVLTPVSGIANTYTIRVAGGRDASCGTFLSTGSACADTFVDLFTSDDGSGRQRWTLTALPGATGSLPLEPFKYNELPLGAIKPTENSWLKNQLVAQANGLHGNLQNFWPSVQTSAWLGGSDYNGLHEGGSYWFNGIVPTAFQLNDQRLLGDVGKWVNYILAHQGSDGWLGPDSNPRVLWGTYPTLLALRQYAQANTTAAPTILNALDRFFVGMNAMITTSGTGLEEWGIMRWADVSLVIEWMVEVFPNGRTAMYLNLLKLLRYFGNPWPHSFSNGVFPTDAINHVDIRFHGVNVVQAIKSEAVAFRYSHNQADIDSTRQRINSIDTFHGRVTGILNADEHLAGKGAMRGTELCMVVEAMYSFEYIYSLLGDNAFADRVEKLAYNALPGTTSENMWEHQYLQQTNQIRAAHMDPSPFATDGPDSNVFGLEPNFPCCTVNHGQGWPKFISHAFMTSPDAKTLYHVLLSPTTFASTLAGGNKVTVSAKTDYPFSSAITYSITADAAFSFGIRVPGYVPSSQISVAVDGGARTTSTANSAGYVVLNIAAGTHTVAATIPMAIQTTQTSGSAVAVVRGPLVYSYSIPFTTTVLRTYALQSRDLQFSPTGPWQFALSRANLVYNGDSNASASVQYPFSQSNPLVSITANVCPISWGVDRNSAAAPPASPAACTGAQQSVRVALLMSEDNLAFTNTFRGLLVPSPADNIVSEKYGDMLEKADTALELLEAARSIVCGLRQAFREKPLLYCDINFYNLVLSKCADGPAGVVIDYDMANFRSEEYALADARTGTRAFQSMKLLLQNSYLGGHDTLDDLEAVFHVLCYVCYGFDRSGELISPAPPPIKSWIDTNLDVDELGDFKFGFMISLVDGLPAYPIRRYPSHQRRILGGFLEQAAQVLFVRVIELRRSLVAYRKRKELEDDADQEIVNKPSQAKLTQIAYSSLQAELDFKSFLAVIDASIAGLETLPSQASPSAPSTSTQPMPTKRKPQEPPNEPPNTKRQRQLNDRCLPLGAYSNVSAESGCDVSCVSAPIASALTSVPTSASAPRTHSQVRCQVHV
ncbi:Ricin B-type lectin domain-containing protein [Mycena kentingensis (nom. inval.)]|nr:Ricin B-type lectin domain-containing protein [Mycena kentingensis (nom. inval.)]